MTTFFFRNDNAQFFLLLIISELLKLAIRVQYAWLLIVSNEKSILPYFKIRKLLPDFWTWLSRLFFRDILVKWRLHSGYIQGDSQRSKQ